jgi:hypothetical protein
LDTAKNNGFSHTDGAFLFFSFIIQTKTGDNGEHHEKKISSIRSSPFENQKAMIPEKGQGLKFTMKRLGDFMEKPQPPLKPVSGKKRAASLGTFEILKTVKWIRSFP